MNTILLSCFIVSFLVVFIGLPFWIKHAKRAQITGKDMHKLNASPVAEMGGIVVIFGFILGVLIYISIDTFFLSGLVKAELARDLKIMASLVSILILSVIGIVDDILGWKIGLRQWQKPILAVIAALPIIVVNAGHSMMLVPLLGRIDIGLIYPLLLVPIAISGASNGFNMLAGYNGLEAGMGALILSALAYVAWVTEFSWVSMLALCMVFALLAFYLFNKCPARVFPGDTLTYPLGALIAIVAILGNLERLALIFFIPYFIELFLKLRGRLKKESFAKVNQDGSLDVPYNKIYSLTHFSILILKKIKRRVYEREVVWSLFLMQAFVICLGLIIRG